MQWWDHQRELYTKVVIEEEEICKEWEADEAFRRVEVGPVALKPLIKEEVVVEVEEGTTMVDVSRVEEGENRFEEAGMVMVDGEEEDGTSKVLWI